MVEQRLERALRSANIPIEGVSIGSDDDRATWRIDYLPAATAQQRAAGEALRLSFNPFEQAVIDAETDAIATEGSGRKDLLATLAVLARETDPNWGTKTLGQRVAAVQALAASWRTMRAFVEKNL